MYGNESLEFGAQNPMGKLGMRSVAIVNVKIISSMLIKIPARRLYTTSTTSEQT